MLNMLDYGNNENFEASRNLPSKNMTKSGQSNYLAFIK
jgi:hypothetical protein